MSKSSTSQTGIQKYKGLILLIGAFLALTVGMLTWSASQTQKLNDKSNELAIATRQGQLSQQLSKSVMDLNLYLAEALQEHAGHEHSQDATTANTLPASELSQETLYTISDLQVARNQFESVLTALEKGGVVEENGQKYTISKLEGADATQRLQKLRNIWNPYLGLIDNFIGDTQKGSINKKSSDYLVDYARLYGQTLLSDSDAITQLINADANAQSAKLRNFQIGAIVFAVALFLGIVFGALRQMLKGDVMLEQANRELSEIMASVREGLFLINKDFTIGKQYSARLPEMLGMEKVSGENFLDVAKKLLPEEELEHTQIFIEQLYSEWVVEELIEDLNPLHRIAIFPENATNPKYLDFKFFRVTNEQGEVQRVLVSVIDSTESVQLQSSIEAQKEQEQRELEMLNTILNTDSRVLANFINVTKERLDEINDALKTSDTNQRELRAKVNFIGRCIHSIKGESSALRLHRMVDICETTEDSLASLRKVNTLTGQDFLGLIVLIEDLFRLVDILDNYSDRLTHGDESEITHVPTMPTLASAEEQHFQQFIQDIAKRSGKQVRLIMDGFDEVHLDGKQRQALQDIAMQILRNAVIHGIEMPQLRQQRGKSEVGTLHLTLTQEDGMITLNAEDDGNGIDFDAIRAKAVSEGQYSVAEAEQFDKKQLLALMLSDGFSTASESTEDAGKGVGMGIIKETVHDMGGKMNISTAPQQYTRFTITMPKF